MDIIEAKQRGQRLIQIRDTLGLSRLKFCEKFGFANTTIAQWETLSGVSPGINQRHARRIIHAVEAAGLVVSEDWFLYGQGNPPYLLKPAEKPAINLFHYACNLESLQGIVDTTVAQLGPAYTAYQIADDAMQPDYNPGDVVIGLISEPHQWLELFNHKACLVTFIDNSCSVRILQEYQPDNYLLRNSNPKTQHSHPVIIDPKIATISQIIIHYRWGQAV